MGEIRGKMGTKSLQIVDCLVSSRYALRSLRLSSDDRSKFIARLLICGRSNTQQGFSETDN